MVANNFLKIFLISTALFFSSPALANTYGEGTYGSERYSGNNSTTTAPNAPTSVTATAGNGQAGISFVPPANNGGAAITSYVVTSSPGNASASGLTSPIVVTGLSNGTSYTFTMVAINTVGTSASSSVSNAVVPTIPPSTSTSGPSYGGGGSTSGSSYSPTTPVNTPITNTPTPTVTENTTNQVTENAQTAVSVFTNNIAVGTIQPQVKSLQEFLNKQGFVVAKTGPGSLGNETSKFGPATKAALIKFQKSRGIPAAGFFGPLTRAAINSLMGGSAGNNSTTTAALENPSIYIRDLDTNMLGEDVKALQQFLNKNGFTVTETGPGSTGNETNKFGPATKAALIKFQKANNLSPAIGYFGPLTRALVITMTK